MLQEYVRYSYSELYLGLTPILYPGPFPRYVFAIVVDEIVVVDEITTTKVNG